MDADYERNEVGTVSVSLAVMSYFRNLSSYAQESDTRLVQPSIRTAIWPAASGLAGVTTVSSLPFLKWAAAAKPVIWTRVPAGYVRAMSWPSKSRPGRCPWSAARRYSRAASVWSCGTPVPCSCITPRLTCRATRRRSRSMLTVRDSIRFAADWAVHELAHRLWHVAVAAVLPAACEALAALAVVVLVLEADRARVSRVVHIAFNIGRCCPVTTPTPAPMPRPRWLLVAAARIPVLFLALDAAVPHPGTCSTAC